MPSATNKFLQRVAAEVQEMIRTQRAFEMNSNVIRAADEVLRSIAQLHR